MKKKILFVDDEESLVRLIKRNLEGTGRYTVQTESNGKNAYRAAKVFNPDMIFLDIIMPGFDSTEIARSIREDKLLSKVPIVFLTATVTFEEIKAGGGSIGGELFLAKPVTVQQLVDTIEQTIGNQ